jgi:nucleoside-diphosphate-sugar epimerase
VNTKTMVIVGAGYTGQELARLAKEAGFDVVATTRDAKKAATLQDLGARPIIWDVDDDLTPLKPYLTDGAYLIYSVPTLFQTYRGDDTPPRHVAPVERLIEACEQGDVARFIYLSSTSVYGDHRGEWVDENTELRPNSSYGKMRADIEGFLMDAQVSFPITVARLGGIYGPGRTLAEYMRKGRYTLIDGGKKVTNRIHVHDVARAILTIIDKGPDEHRIFNFTDGHPQPARDVVEFVCEQTSLDWPPEETIEEYARRTDNPNRLARRTNAIRVLNERLRRELDFELVYPDVFAGYQATLSHEEDQSGEPVKGPPA